MSNTGDAIFPRGNRAYHFASPREVHRAITMDQVLPVLRAVDEALAAGRWVAGYVAFEAAPAFDPAFHAHPPGDLPLVWFGIYDEPAIRPAPPPPEHPIQTGPWRPDLDETAYREAIARIHAHIVAGDTYQVNYTFPLLAPNPGRLNDWFWQLSAGQGTGHAAFLDTGRFKVLSASPELFFSRKCDRLVSRPMKGTRPRGLWSAQDQALRNALVSSEKDRAENIMIVDMVRNDLGRVAQTGSVAVPTIFAAERYETVWQMTSTVECRTHAELTDIFGALFPPASVTGAPKVETMKIIHQLEPMPRGVYCGAVGFAGPDRQADFNVAIRTVTVDEAAGTVTYPVGSGVTHGSEAGSEFQECLDKAALLSFTRAPFELIESLRFEGDYFLLEEHLRRLEESATYFGISVDEEAITHDLLAFAEGLPSGAHKVRLLVDRGGQWRITAGNLVATAPQILGFAREPVDKADVFLYHKTTQRETYTHALASRPECDDVLLWNRDGEVTESCMANLVVEIGGKRLTPPVSCGLLGGTFRRHLLNRGEITERILTPEDVLRADQIFLANSVRQWIPARLTDTAPPEG